MTPQPDHHEDIFVIKLNRMAQSPARLAAKASMRRREGKAPEALSFRARATRHGIQNLPDTPKIRTGQTNNFFEDGFDAALKEAENESPAAAAMAREQYWVRVKATEEEGGGFCYVPAMMVEAGSRKGSYRFQRASAEGEIFTADKSDIGPLVDMDNTTPLGVPNLVDIVNVHEATILENLRKRYARDEFMVSVVANVFCFEVFPTNFDTTIYIIHYLSLLPNINFFIMDTFSLVSFDFLIFFEHTHTHTHTQKKKKIFGCTQF